ncbi:hypothetical protein CY0110_15692 [Crocosphaera chwakensis CCY0110]|uniref:Uncharacterized protein n=1 Tax=Crocosphaera chwakensis CCY0110 TaxID=391612 RepID=A3IHH0_9CHRO|nr:hypothetical protein CY0110_15692 [Crocosphaera chwakensis CCY0110]
MGAIKSHWLSDKMSWISMPYLLCNNTLLKSIIRQEGG